MKSFIKYVSTVSDWAGRVAGWMIPILMIIVAYDVVKRYVFNAATSWAFDFSWMLYGASFILGGAYVLFHKSHIRVDVILNRFAPQTKGILVALIFGFVMIGGAMLPQSFLSVWNIMTCYPFAAVSLFVLMGVLLQYSGAADRLFGGLHLLLGRVGGGLTLTVMIIATIFGACTGIAGASVVTMGLLALPLMLKAGYDKRLASGTICAGGGLGVIIPPSVLLILYGPIAGVSIASLFTAAIIPGLVLSAIYLGYIYVRCRINPKLGPPMPAEERKVPVQRLVRMTLVNLIPSLFLILAVLGSIMFGVAAPTEAAALGALGALIITIAYGKFSWQLLKSSVYDSIRIISMMIFIAVGAKIFTNVFLSLGGGRLIGGFFMGLELPLMGALFLMLLLNFVLGAIMDWIGLLFILVPVYVPIVNMLGIDPLWFGILFCVTLQISYMTPPFAYSAFYLKGVAPPEVSLGDIYLGSIPFVILQVIGVAIFIMFPQLSLWLPSLIM